MNSAPYPIYLSNNGWNSRRPDPETRLVLRGHDRCDAIVVGGGYTGLAVAKRLAEQLPDHDIRILEASRASQGASGRNSGFLVDTVFASNSHDNACELHRRYHTAMQELLSIVGRRHRGGERETILKAAASPRGEKTLRNLREWLAKSGQPVNALGADTIRAIIGSNYYRYGLELPTNRLINPRNLIEDLTRSLADRFTLYENSPALNLVGEANGWCVHTPEGTLRAPQVFLTNNAFAKGLGVGKNRLIRIYTYAGVTDPLPSSINPGGEWGLLPAHRLGTTFRTTPQGQLLVRGFYGYERETDSGIRQRLTERLARRFPDIAQHLSLSHWWGGATGLTGNGAPLWGKIRDGVYTSAGCNGVGIVKGWLLGTRLAELACGRSGEDITHLFGRANWIPPEPSRRLGFRAVSLLENRLAASER